MSRNVWPQVSRPCHDREPGVVPTTWGKGGLCGLDTYVGPIEVEDERMASTPPRSPEPETSKTPSDGRGVGQ